VSQQLYEHAQARTEVLSVFQLVVCSQIQGVFDMLVDQIHLQRLMHQQGSSQAGDFLVQVARQLLNVTYTRKGR
jgi:hypothetical protein